MLSNEEYLDEKLRICPFCFSSEIESFGVDTFDENTLIREVGCFSCKKNYKEYFTAFKHVSICDCLPEENDILYEEFPINRDLKIIFSVNCCYCDNKWNHEYIYSHYKSN